MKYQLFSLRFRLRILIVFGFATASMLIGSMISAQVLCLPDNPQTIGGLCMAETECQRLTSFRQVVRNTDCEAQATVCCPYTAAYMDILRQACASQGGACGTSCSASEAIDFGRECPSPERCCPVSACASVGGICATSSACTTNGGVVSTTPGCTTGQICCVAPTPTTLPNVTTPPAPSAPTPPPPSPSDGSTGSESAEPSLPAGTAVLPAAGSSVENRKGNTQASYGLTNPLGSRSINDIAAALIKYASGIAGTLMLVYMLWGGVQYMTATDQKSVGEAQKRIVWAVIGIAVIFFAYVIIDAVISLSSLAPGA